MTAPTSTPTFATVADRPAASLAAVKGWHPDPQGQHRLRYHDGHDFTDHTTHWGPVPCRGCAHVA